MVISETEVAESKNIKDLEAILSGTLQMKVKLKNEDVGLVKCSREWNGNQIRLYSNWIKAEAGG